MLNKIYLQIPAHEKSILTECLDALKVIADGRYRFPNGTGGAIWLEIHHSKECSYEEIGFGSPSSHTVDDSLIFIKLPIGTVFGLAMESFQKRESYEDVISNADIEIFNEFLDFIVNDRRRLTMDFYRYAMKRSIFSNSIDFQQYDFDFIKDNARAMLYEYAEEKPFIATSCRSLSDIFAVTFTALAESGRTLRKCQLCGKYFVPWDKREIYCNNLNPRYPQKTCKEAYRLINLIETNKKSDSRRLYRQIYNRLYIRAIPSSRKEGKKITKIDNELNDFVKKANVWKDHIKASIATDAEYYEWLLEQDRIIGLKRKPKGAK